MSVVLYTLSPSFRCWNKYLQQKIRIHCSRNQLLAACAQTLCKLRQHGLPTDALQLVFQTTVISGCPMLRRRGGASPNTQVRMFWGRWLSIQFTYNTRHLLHPLFLPTHDYHCDLRSHRHNFTLPSRSSALLGCNFIYRMPYNKDLKYSSYSQ